MLWLTDPEMRAWRGLVQATTGLLAILDNELQAAHGLSLGDYEVLVHLSEAPDRSLRMSELAGRLHLSPSGITRRIDGLVRSGLVERRQCPSDRRGSNAFITAAFRWPRCMADVMPSTRQASITPIDGGITAATGFRSAALHCGIKAKADALVTGDPDNNRSPHDRIHPARWGHFTPPWWGRFSAHAHI